MSGRSALEAALARLHEVHEAFEDAAGRLPEGDRQRTCRAVLAAAGAAALGDTLRAGAAAALNSMCASCLDALVSGWLVGGEELSGNGALGCKWNGQVVRSPCRAPHPPHPRLPCFLACSPPRLPSLAGPRLCRRAPASGSGAVVGIAPGRQDAQAGRCCRTAGAGGARDAPGARRLPAVHVAGAERAAAGMITCLCRPAASTVHVVAAERAAVRVIS